MDLKVNIETIMKSYLSKKLTAGNRVLLTAVGVLGVAGPIAFGGLYPSHAVAQQSRTQAGQGAHPSWDRSRPGEKFEVASVKPSTPGQGMMGRPSSPGRLSVDHAPLAELIRLAFSAKPWEISGIPSWASSAYYAIDAKAPRPASLFEMWPMLAPLLEDRFKMKWHRENKVIPIYILSVAKNGPKLPKPGKGSCLPVDRSGPIGPGKHPLAPCGSTLMPVGTPGRAELYGGQVQMASLVSRLTDILGCPVIDKTGFTAPFDLQIEFAFEMPGRSYAQPLQESRGESAGDPAGAPHISTALKQQLGLRIDSGKAPVEVIVIDSIEKPLPN